MCRLAICVFLLAISVVASQENEGSRRGPETGSEPEPEMEPEAEPEAESEPETVTGPNKHQLRVMVAKRRQQRVWLRRLYRHPDQLLPRWKQLDSTIAAEGDMSYFSVYNRSHGGFTKRITVCNYFLSSLITDAEDCPSLDESATTDFSFFASDVEIAGTHEITFKVCLDLTTNITYSVISDRTAQCGRYSTDVKSGHFYAFPGNLFCGTPNLFRSDKAVVLNKIFEDEVRLQSVTFDCITGYEIVVPTMNCSTSGRWDPRWSRCQGVSCGNPPIEHGYSTGKKWTFPATTRYGCNEGYVLSPPNARSECEATGQWSGTTPDCNLVDCGPPQSIPHGSVNGTVFTYGQRLMTVCDEGHKQYTHRPRVIECKANGTWAGAREKCYIIRCTSPNILRHGRRLGQHFTYGRTVHFECDEGYTLVGHSTIKCGRRLDMLTPTAAWIGFIPTCEANTDEGETLNTVLPPAGVSLPSHYV